MASGKRRDIDVRFTGPPGPPPKGYMHVQVPGSATCPKCKGRGWTWASMTCPQCGGKKTIPTDNWATVPIEQYHRDARREEARRSAAAATSFFVFLLVVGGVILWAYLTGNLH